MTLDAAFIAISDPHRRHLLEELRRGAKTVTELAAGLPVSRPAVSQHLKILLDAGLVTATPDGTQGRHRVVEKKSAAGRWARTASALALGVMALACSSAAGLAADCRAQAAPGVDWTECDKKLLILRGSDLNGAQLGGANLTSTDLRDANLLAANLEKATLVRASLAGARAKGANFTRIEAYRTDFSGIDAEGSIFNSAEIQRSTFTGATVANVDFTKAELGRAQFDDADITGSRFSLANVARADFRKAKFTGAIDFAGAFFFLTRIDGVDLSAATGLAQWQVDMACGSPETKLPAGLNPGASWPCTFE